MEYVRGQYTNPPPQTNAPNTKDIKRPSKNGPESDEYNKLKGKMIRIWYPGEKIILNELGRVLDPIWVGRLIWVDKFTLGVQFDESTPDKISIVYKTSIMRVDSFE